MRVRRDVGDLPLRSIPQTNVLPPQPSLALPHSTTPWPSPMWLWALRRSSPSSEIDAHSVSIHAHFLTLRPQKLKADQLANRERVSEALKEHLRRAISTLPAAGSVVS
jgi:hypothetical protein